jgi:hypothetical protein
MLEFPNMGFYPLYDPSLFPSPPLCGLPFYTTSKPTEVCAGRGTVFLTTTLVDEVIQIYPDQNDNLFTPTCTSLILTNIVTGSNVWLPNSNDSIAAQSFGGNGTRINIISDTIYWRVNNVYTVVPCLSTNCTLNANLTIECYHPLPQDLASAGLLWVSLWDGPLS